MTIRAWPVDETDKRSDDSIDVHPSLSEHVTRCVQKSDAQMTRECLLNGIIAQLMNRLGKTVIVLPSFDVECGQRVTVHPETVTATTADKHYHVEIQPGKSGS